MYYKVWNELDEERHEIKTCIQPKNKPTGEVKGNTLEIDEQLLGEIIYTLFSKGLYATLKILEQNNLLSE